MEKENLTLDDFLSRFQRLRPQVNREALNQRQAAVLLPVVRRAPPGLQYHASVDEVSAVFEMPLDEALRLSRYHPLDIQRRGHDHRVWLSWYQHYFVWGMTAGIIRELALQIGLKP